MSSRLPQVATDQLIVCILITDPSKVKEQTMWMLNSLVTSCSAFKTIELMKYLVGVNIELFLIFKVSKADALQTPFNTSNGVNGQL